MEETIPKDHKHNHWLYNVSFKFEFIYEIFLAWKNSYK
jgi:hypothetical protein